MCKEFLYKPNTDCKHYPCHDIEELQSCYYCSCPLYPCRSKRRGKWIKLKDIKVWDCSNCGLPHDVNFVKLFRKNWINKTKGD